eukprot:800821_1
MEMDKQCLCYKNTCHCVDFILFDAWLIARLLTPIALVLMRYYVLFICRNAGRLILMALIFLYDLFTGNAQNLQSVLWRWTSNVCVIKIHAIVWILSYLTPGLLR